jgi:hypothetical protein
MLPIPHHAVIYKRVDGGAVVYHAADEIYYGLNDLGARIWELLPSCATVEALGEHLHREFPDVSADRIHGDVRALVESLVGYGLLEPPAHPAA